MFLRAGLRLAGHEEILVRSPSGRPAPARADGPRARRRDAPGQLVGRLTIEYRPGDLLRGRIEALSVEGLTLRGRVDRDGLRLEGRDLAAGPGGTSATGAAPAGAGLDPRPPARADHPGRRGHGPGRGAAPPSRGPRHIRARRAGRGAGRADRTLQADLHVEGAMPLDVRSLADAITASGRGAVARLDLARRRARHRRRGRTRVLLAAGQAGWRAVEPPRPTGIARPGMGHRRPAAARAVAH